MGMVYKLGTGYTLRDHVDALLLISQDGDIGEDFCIGGDSEMKNIDLVKAISKIINDFSENKHSIEELICFVEDRPGHDKGMQLTSEKLKGIWGGSLNSNLKMHLK